MSKILSYNKKSNGTDWFSITNQYSADEIEEITDPDGGLRATPRTAIPSPFAQMDLVKTAFLRLSGHPMLQGQPTDERLVANALDIAQLMFNYAELHGQVSIIRWDRDVQLQALLDEPQHRLFGETLRMYMRQDAHAYNFDRMEQLFFLIYKNQVLGGTSPCTLFMASPSAIDMYDIQVEQDVPIFAQWRPLYERDPEFVRYIYCLFGAYPELKRLCPAFNAYLITAFAQLPTRLQDEIVQQTGNPSAMDMTRTDICRSQLEQNYEMMPEGVNILGIPLYQRRADNLMNAIAKSDFVIAPTRQQPEGEKLPLILQNNLNAPSVDPFIYIGRPWSDMTKITLEDYAVAPEYRILPATNHQYPWLSVDDFLQPALIKLDYAIDRDCFFDGNIQKRDREVDTNSFLLPIKPLYFRYFNAQDLRGTIAGRPRCEMIHTRYGNGDAITVVLRIPVQKAGKYITLSRTYLESRDTVLTYNREMDMGYYITVPFAVSVYPFVRMQHGNQYQVQLIDRALGRLMNYGMGVDFYHDGYQQLIKEPTTRQRSLKAEKHMGSTYYSLPCDFDYMNVYLTDEMGNRVVESTVIPVWPTSTGGHEAFTFAVDFGTTNTHVEYMREEEMPRPLTIEMGSRERLVATLYNGESVLYDVIIKQEFSPRVIGQDYRFPQRTVLSECERVDARNADTIVALGDANIPFIYEKESIGYGNRIIPNLKWSTEPANAKRVACYMRELAMMMRTKVLLEGGDLSKTRLVWFYPLSMKSGNVSQMTRGWERTFREVFGIEPTEHNLIQMPESVAPYYYYRSSSKFKGAASTVASVDIGGGTCDVVVFESNKSEPTFLTSFRFAANVLFGDAFAEMPQGDSNPMLRRYVQYFASLFEHDDDRYGELHGILDEITEKKKSEDINAFLFSVVNSKAAAGNEVFSYNARLGEDQIRRVIFLYFYTTIIYYIARMMKHRGVAMPRSIMFSGTGSKVLDIVGGQRELDQLSRAIIERVYGNRFDQDGFGIVMERNEPKQITCRGGLMQVRGDGITAIRQTNDRIHDYEQSIKCNYTMLPHETLRYQDMDDPAIRAEVVQAVRQYNDFFIRFVEEMHLTDKFLIDTRAWRIFQEHVSRDLEHHLVQGWAFVNRNQSERNDMDIIEDPVFFYPIVGSIRYNLIENLKEID